MKQTVTVKVFGDEENEEGGKKMLVLLTLKNATSATETPLRNSKNSREFPEFTATAESEAILSVFELSASLNK